MPAKKSTSKQPNDQIDPAIALGQETVEQAFKAGEKVMRAGQKVFEKLDTEKTLEVAREQLETAGKTLFPGQEKVTALSLATFDAYATAFQAFSKGTEQLGAEVAAFTLKSMESSIENGKTVMSCKSIKEAFGLRNELARSTVDMVMAEGAKLTEMSLKTANESWAPIQNHARQAFDAFGGHRA
jgi:hypothetical protein